MNVLLIGSGGREHALSWKLAQSPMLSKLYAAPGNPGIAAHAELVALNGEDPDAALAFAQEKDIGLLVIGPEAPLVAGLADRFRAAGIPVFGPDAAPAQLESSKGFTKDFCARHGIPTAGYSRVDSREGAEAAIARFGYPAVIKADGLAAGKGVVIAQDQSEASAALDEMARPGARLVIEEFMTGEEVSFFALTDGTRILPFGSAQDHKRVGDGDTGPNTGGMGAYSPASILTPELERRAMDEIVVPTVRAMAERGAPYSGILYAGLMLTAEGPKLIEYNVRFGDPECQVLMMRLESDLLELMYMTARGRLADAEPPRFTADAALTVVMAAKGYPGTPEKGGAISSLEAAAAEESKIFHAGTRLVEGELVADGGRVLNVTGRGATVAKARDAAYAAVDRIDFPTGFCRRDIGWREVARGG
jgi:phosphoribosylamine--glycine ligase